MSALPVTEREGWQKYSFLVTDENMGLCLYITDIHCNIRSNNNLSIEGLILFYFRPYSFRLRGNISALW